MAQGDLNVANQSGAAFRADLNNQLAALGTLQSGASAPSTTFAYMLWADATAGLLKIRNAANSGWITVGTLADANLGLLPTTGGVLTGNLTLNAQNDLRLADADSSNWVALQAPATVASNLTLTVPAADGTADQALVTDGSGALSFASRSRLVRGTAVATTSGTSIDFTSIPSWVKRITVIFTSVSTAGTSPVQVQLGDSGGVETTGYTGTAVAIVSTNSLNIASYTSGAVLIGQLTTTVRSGSMVITNINGNEWQFSSINANDDVGYLGWTSVIKTLSATLDRVRLTTVNGTDTFDAGTANIIYEG
jgi:hypothetical protein